MLVYGRSAGFVHCSVPLTGKMVEALGSKTGAWTTTVTYDPADINPANLKQYDAIVLASTTGYFLDDANDAAATKIRRDALLEFIRGGKGIVGIHAASDSYHTRVPVGQEATAPSMPMGRGGGGCGVRAPVWRFPVAPLVMKGDANGDQKLTRAEFAALGDAWFAVLDPDKTGKVTQAEFASRFAAILRRRRRPTGGCGVTGTIGGLTAVPGPRGNAGQMVQAGAWPEWNKIIGGYFKFHWNDPQLITVKIDDPKSPLTAMFNGQDFEIRDETYTYAQHSFSRENVHVLTSVNYDKMSAEDKAKEPADTRGPTAITRSAGFAVRARAVSSTKRTATTSASTR